MAYIAEKTIDLKSEITAIEGLIDLGLENEEYRTNVTVKQMYNWLTELEDLRKYSDARDWDEEYECEADEEDEYEGGECEAGTCVCAETGLLNSIFFGRELDAPAVRAIIQATEDKDIRDYLERLIGQFKDFLKSSSNF